MCMLIQKNSRVRMRRTSLFAEVDFSVPSTKSMFTFNREPRFLALTFLTTNLPQFSLGNSMGSWVRSKGLLMFSSVEDTAFI